MKVMSASGAEPGPAVISVAVVEDDARVRAGLAALLEGTPGFRCHGTFPSAEAALKVLPHRPPDVALLDINLPGQSGIELARQLKRAVPDVQLIMVTVYEDEDSIFEALVASATGYLLKNTEPVRILDAIREVRAGGSPMSGFIARRIVDYFRAARPRPVASAAPSGDAVQLSAREQEILQLLARGYRYKELADALHISVNTVRTHLRRIYEKLQVSNGLEAVNKFLRGGDAR